MPMTGLTLRLVKGSSLTASEGDQNWTIIRNAFNALEALFGVSLKANGQLKDGAVGSAAVIADGIITNAKLAADARIPAGTIFDYGAASAPSGYLLCDGSAVSRTTYADLFAAIGTSYGVGDGSTTFNVPDCRGRVRVGTGAGSGLTNRTIGQTFGTETHTLVIGEIPAHTHTYDRYTPGSASSSDPVDGTNVDGGHVSTASGSAGSGTAHANTQPSIVCTAIIKT